ncbi:MAG TPA: hypothetical protein VH853_17945 [Polyangia bacterium]|nr:hypothetical protein [Polyangia bacterium]
MQTRPSSLRLPLPLLLLVAGSYLAACGGGSGGGGASGGAGAGEGGHAGAGAGGQAGEGTGGQAGAASGGQAGTGTGAGGTSAGGQAGTSAGGQAGSSAGGQAGTSAGGQAGTSTGGQAGTSAGGQAGSSTSAGGQAGTSVGGQAGTGVGGAAGGGGAPVACNNLVNSAPLVDKNHHAEAPPVMTGGTIADGTYFLTAMDKYNGETGTSSHQEVWVYSGNTIQVVQEDGTHFSLSYVAANNALTYTITCPAAQAGMMGVSPYTASATQIVSVNSDDANELHTFTKQ